MSERFASLANATETRDLGVTRNGLALVISYCLEVIQQTASAGNARRQIVRGNDPRYRWAKAACPSGVRAAISLNPAREAMP